MGEQLEVQTKVLEDLIDKNKIQRLNAVSASNVQHQDVRSWRVKGAQENWNFYIETIKNMEERARQYSNVVDCIEDAIVGFQNETHFTPASIGASVDHQRQMYLQLAGRVAELHQEVDRVVKRRRIV